MGNSVSNAVLQMLNSGQFPEGFNHTFITLIPKKDRVNKVENFRSISLYNVIYKLVAKVLTNRLKTVLPNIISETQNAFVPKRHISDNILVAYELIYFLRGKRK